MKVSELIAVLQDCDPEAHVHFSYNYGDHWRTIVAPEVKAVDPDGRVIHSDYHEMPKLLDDEDDEKYNNLKPVVVLSASG